MIALALMILAADPALTGPTASATTESVDRVAGKNPNEIICEVQEELGSRLKGHKVCATRAEWAERRRQARNEVDLQQQNRPTKGN